MIIALPLILSNSCGTCDVVKDSRSRDEDGADE